MANLVNLAVVLGLALLLSGRIIMIVSRLLRSQPTTSRSVNADSNHSAANGIPSSLAMIIGALHSSMLIGVIKIQL
jgi:hypothetical protein